MTRQAWVICGAAFIEGDVIRWHEGVFQTSRYDRKHRSKIGERSITAQVLYDPLDRNEMLELQVLTSEGSQPFKPDAMIRRARKTISREDTERLEWSDEEARASVIDSLPEAQRKNLAQAQQIAADVTSHPQQTRAIQTKTAGAPWRRRRNTGGSIAARP